MDTNTIIALVCCAAVLIGAGIARIIRMHKHMAPASAAQDGAFDEFSTGFFKRVQDGEKAQKFLQIASLGDCALIQGLLQSADIPSYTDFTHINRFFGPLNEATPSGLSITLQIIAADYDDASAIVKDYIEKKGNSTGITVYPKEN